jgi:hypothetical protein
LVVLVFFLRCFGLFVVFCLLFVCGFCFFFAGDTKKCKEDNGFALSKWSKIVFENSDIIIKENQGLAMGNYTFENNESKIKVEYSFGYIKIKESIKISLHHSSIPYQN